MNFGLLIMTFAVNRLTTCYNALSVSFNYDEGVSTRLFPLIPLVFKITTNIDNVFYSMSARGLDRLTWTIAIPMKCKAIVCVRNLQCG